jgi:hypothetical protein
MNEQIAQAFGFRCAAGFTCLDNTQTLLAQMGADLGGLS